MTHKLDDGGPAFPGNDCQVGMSLRDYFAGQALVAMVRGYDAETGEGADMAYRYADAMIDRRKKTEAGK